MKLDDLRKTVNGEEQMAAMQDGYSLEEMKASLRNFDKAMRRNLVIETLISGFAFVAVTAMIFGGHYLYPHIIKELFPDFSQGFDPEMNAAMYASLFLMALFCIVVPAKRYLAEKTDVSLSWTLTSRIESEIVRMEKQYELWSTAHIWSIVPAAIIGVLFFWGLNKSLLGTWFPSVYLWLYFGFVALSVFGGLWLKNDMIGKNIQPLLDRLYIVRHEIRGEVE